MSGPLAGIRVYSMAEQYPGPYATLILADLGADVILIERPGMGDPSRASPPFFSALNRGKRSIALDLKDSDARKRLLRLLADADVFLEGFRPGVATRLGLDYDIVAAANRRLVYVSISGYGQTGPYRSRPGHDLSFQALAGLLFRSAAAGQAEPDIAIADLSSGLFAAIGVLAALVRRQATGTGTHVDVSMADGLVSLMTVHLAPLLNGGRLFDLREPGFGVFACADGRLITLSIAGEDHFWRSLATLLGLDDVAGFGRSQRKDACDALRSRIAAALQRRPRNDWAVALDDAGIPWGPVNSLAEVTADLHFRDRGLFVPVESSRGAEWHVAQPLKFLGEATGPRGPAPGLGEHTAEITATLGRGS